MPVGNIECPNCGATFEYDSEKNIAECPNCQTKFMVRDVKMNSVVNNYYGDGGNKSLNGGVSKKSSYENECEKLVAYAQHSEGKQVNRIITTISTDYPNSYFYEIVRLYDKHGQFFAFLSTDKYKATKKNMYDSVSDRKMLASDIYIEMIKSLKEDGFNITESQNKALYVKDDKGNVTDEMYVDECDNAIYFFEQYVNFVNDVEEDDFLGKSIKYDFEQQHFNELLRLRDDALQKLEKYRQLKKDFLDFINNNKMKCNEYLDELEDAKGSGISYYTYGLDKSKSTGLWCDILGIIALVASFALTSVNIAIFDVLFFAGYILCFIGYLRYNGGDEKEHWWFIFLPPIFIVAFIIRAIDTFRLVGRSKRTYKQAKKKWDNIANNLKQYRDNALYKTINEMANAFNFDFSSLR